MLRRSAGRVPVAVCFHDAGGETARPGHLRRAACASPKTKRGLIGEMTLEQVCPKEYQGAQYAFKDSMIH